MPLTARDVSHAYRGAEGAIRALNGVSVSIDAGEAVLLAGRNGSGKSTLLHILAGMLRPSHGSVIRDGTAALAIQYPERALLGGTVFDDVAFGPRNSGRKPEEVGEDVAGALVSLGLAEDILKKDTRDLSYGQKRLVALAGIFAMGPRHLLLDEPLAGLDAAGKRAVIKAIVRARERGSSVVVASHDLKGLPAACTRIVILDGGTIVEDCEPERLKSRGFDLHGIVMPDALLLARELERKGVDTRGAWTPGELADCAFRHHCGRLPS